MSVIINPGSGPVSGECTIDNAQVNIEAFVADLTEKFHVTVSARPTEKSENYDEYYAGRWPFIVTVHDKDHEVDMPGLPLDRVRYVGDDDQNIWGFPRLYVDGSSWVWLYAVGACGPEEQE